MSSRRNFNQGSAAIDLFTLEKSDNQLPNAEKYGKKSAKVDLFAVVDGHEGAEASETVKQQLVDKFLNYVVMDAFHKATDFDNKDDLHMTKEGFRSCSQGIKDAESLRKILELSLSEAIRAIDWEFTLASIRYVALRTSLFKKPCNAGSTASVVLMLNNEQFLVANAGNSKVILCAGVAEQLTSYHNRSDAPRVKGEPAVSRVIGDAKSIKVWTSVDLQMVGWRNITAEDRYLVVASTGIFESLTPENVCQLVESANLHETIGCSYDLNCPSLESLSLALAHYVVRAASEMGSTDNLSAVVVPLAQAACVHKCKMTRCDAAW
ncbi:PPM-type phosphatase domain, Protein phosphatase 2C family [Artemisia annua]|uniref:PPM-type phosphatase domain, Protein phosphatase 2C family n=1 Tax=Artemisia annua TaxID=35608 RepID=A0A2U1QF06_ARTAN|nr:PPM-type phosphatase domain, Protein phosphatase 2C family [Artemisia annua]